jgi:hypothetical protein
LALYPKIVRNHITSGSSDLTHQDALCAAAMERPSTHPEATTGT